MKSEERVAVHGEDLEKATEVATRLIHTRCEGPDVWVRLVVTEGAGVDVIYHFDASSSLMAEQLRVIVRRAAPGQWQAALDG